MAPDSSVDVAPVVVIDLVSELSARVGHEFADRSLLRLSMAHRSWCAESGGQSNERLEFLGDSVLGLAVTNFIYRRYPDLPEGDLAKLRASVVNAQALADAALQLDLGAFILLGKGEESTGGREKSSILADALEAVFGAVYLDGGWDAAERLILRLLGELIREYADGPGGSDYKTRLQELAAHQFDQLPIYRVVGAGPDHQKTFDAEVLMMGQVRGTGTGRSKKVAEQAAAKIAWGSLMDELASRGPSAAS